MPRPDSNSIRYGFEENPSSREEFGSFRTYWTLYPNSIGVPAGKRQGRYNTMEALKRVQERYWKKGIPMGMEVELELDIPEENSEDICSCDCDYCEYDAPTDHQYVDCGCTNSNVHYNNYEPVREVLSITNKQAQQAWMDFANRKHMDYFQYTAPITAKGDPSLRNGVEFNYQPMTVSAFRKFAANVYEDVGYSKFIGFNAETTGLHIHMPMAAFSEPEHFMFLRLWETLTQVRGSRGLTFIEMIAQREENRWANAVHFGNLMDRVANRTGTGGRYYQLALRGRTMECRAFKTNVQPQRLIKNMAFLDMAWRYTHLLMDYVNDEKYVQATQFLTDPNMFVQYINNPNAKGYTEELASYVNKRWKRRDVNVNRIVVPNDTISNLQTLNERFQSREWETPVEDNTTNETNEEVNS